MFPIMGYLKMSLCLGKSSNRQKQSIHRVGIAMSYGLHLQMMTEISVFFVSYYIFAWFIMECCILARTQVLDRLIYVLRWLTSEIISCYFWGLQMHSFPGQNHIFTHQQLYLPHLMKCRLYGDPYLIYLELLKIVGSNSSSFHFCIVCVMHSRLQ